MDFRSKVAMYRRECHNARLRMFGVVIVIVPPDAVRRFSSSLEIVRRKFHFPTCRERPALRIELFQTALLVDLVDHAICVL